MRASARKQPRETFAGGVTRAGLSHAGARHRLGPRSQECCSLAQSQPPPPRSTPRPPRQRAGGAWPSKTGRRQPGKAARTEAGGFAPKKNSTRKKNSPAAPRPRGPSRALLCNTTQRYNIVEKYSSLDMINWMNVQHNLSHYESICSCTMSINTPSTPQAARGSSPSPCQNFGILHNFWPLEGAPPISGLCSGTCFPYASVVRRGGPRPSVALGIRLHTLPLEPEAVRTVLVPLRVWAGTRLGSPWPRRAPPGPPPLRLSVPSGTCASAASMSRPASARPRACARRRPRSPWPPRRPTLAGARAPVAAGPDVARRGYRSARPRLRACAAGAVPHTASLCVRGQLGPLLTGFPTPLPRSSGCRRRPCPPHAVPHAGQERARPRPATRVRLCCGV